MIRNHPFIDGNKRIGLMAAYTFLGRNGIEFVATEIEVVLNTLGLAVNHLTEEDYAAWLKQNSRRPTKAKKRTLDHPTRD
ncbi:MAG: type II toxin-antitoxin system death-on-curing family toxin [Verrucomicrobiota bacterium]